MTRSRMNPIRQPDENSCGPASLKLALAMLGKRVSVRNMMHLCNTNKNGTTTNNMIRAIKKLGISALVLEKTTLRHLLSSLRNDSMQKRAVLVSYLYSTDKNNRPNPDSGHWAVVSSYKPATGRIVLLDSYTGRKTSYNWLEFRRRWIDQTLKRRRISLYRSKYRMIQKQERQLMIVMATYPTHLPKFSSSSARWIYPRRRLTGIQ